jgi:hypothetical protein
MARDIATTVSDGGSATVRGTEWLTEDASSPSTLTPWASDPRVRERSLISRPV